MRRFSAISLIALTLATGCRSDILSPISGASCQGEPRCGSSQRGKINTIFELSLGPTKSINASTVGGFEVSGQCTAEGAQVIISGDAAAVTKCENRSYNARLDFRHAPDGLVELRLRHGNASPVRVELVKDTKGPQLSWSAGDPNTLPDYSRFPLIGTCDEKGGRVLISGSANAEAECDGSNFFVTADLSSLNDGSLTFRADLLDAAGNAATQSVTTSIKDTVSPIARINGAPISSTNSADYQVSVSALEPVSYKFVVIPVIQNCNSATYSSAWRSDNIPISGSVGGEGTYRLCVIARDNAGNIQSKSQASSIVWTYDITPPSVRINNSGYVNADVATNYVIEGSCSENGRAITISGSISTIANCETNHFEVIANLSNIADGGLVLTASHRDAAGNNATPFTVSLIKDTISLPIVSNPVISVASGDSYVILDWREAIDANATQPLEYAIFRSLTNNNYVTPSDWETNTILVQNYKLYEGSIQIQNLESDRDHWFNIVVRDEAGNRVSYHPLSTRLERVPVEDQVELTALGDSSKRKIVFDNVSKRYWAFFRKGQKLVYNVSLDQTAWTKAGEIFSPSGDFSIGYKSNSTGINVILALESDGADIIVKRGRVINGALTFDGIDNKVFDGDGSLERYSSPSIAISDEGFISVSAVRKITSKLIGSKIVVIKSNETLNESTITWHSATALGPEVGEIKQQIIISQGGENLLLVRNSSELMSWEYAGSEWVATEGDAKGAWFSFPLEMSDSSATIEAITFWDGKLIIGGQFAFLNTEGELISNIAQWDGTTWKALGDGVTDTVHALVADDNNLYVGGEFTQVGSISAQRVALWNGTNWQPLGDGLDNTVYSLAINSDGKLYAGGAFTNNAELMRIAKWNGIAWVQVGAGLNNVVRALKIDSSGNLYAGGDFTKEVDSITIANKIAKWNGEAWISLGTGVNDGLVNALAIANDGKLYIGGQFNTVNGAAALNIARWDPANLTWSGVGSGFNGVVKSLEIDSGGDLYAGGDFTLAGTLAAKRIAKWSADTWKALGSGLDSSVQAIGINKQGPNPDLFFGGSFSTAGGFVSTRVASWRPSALTTGSSGGLSLVADAGRGIVHAISAHEDGTRYSFLQDSAWSTPQILSGQSGKQPTLSLDENKGDLWAFWIEGSSLKQGRKTNETWSSSKTISSTGQVVVSSQSLSYVEADPFVHATLIFQDTAGSLSRIFLRTAY